MSEILKGCSISWARSISEVDKDQWNRLAAELNFPFLRWQWLNLVESSGSACIETGWIPIHLLIHKDGILVAAAALYMKTHSDGEFIFDRVWSEVAEKGDIRYYPKLVGMSPFTPATGYRFLIDPKEDREEMTALMCKVLDRFSRINGLGSCAFHFVDARWALEMEKFGYSSWQHQGYSWENTGFNSFEDWLGTVNRNRRKTIRRERRELQRESIRVVPIYGENIPLKYFDYMYRLYERTNDRFGEWSCKFLTRDFFECLPEIAGDSVLFMTAFRGDSEDPLAMAMFTYSADKLWGRYWGCFEEVRFLHFELCYYSAFEWAIRHGIKNFDPGMGGEHKARRGFLSTPTYSLHRFINPSMDLTFKTYIQEVNQLENGYIKDMNDLLPVI
jgi:hypothetical protein